MPTMIYHHLQDQGASSTPSTPSLPHLHQPLRLKGLINNSSPNIYFHYYNYINYTFVMSTGQEGLGEHIRALATPERKVFLPGTREKASKTKTSVPRRP
jgi:hypothetical protein